MDLCGKDQPFWNQTLTWDTDVPTLTRCFRRTIFTSLPLAFFWLVFPFHVRNLRQKTLYTTRKLSVLSTVKYLLAGFLCLVAIIDLLYWVLDQHYMIMDLIESVFRAVTFLAVIFLIRMELVYGARISPRQFIFWLILSILSVPNTYCEVLDYFYFETHYPNKLTPVDHLLPLITMIVQTILLFGSLICHFFSESRPEYQRPASEEQESVSSPETSKESPIMNASFPSILTFSWFTGFAWTGFKRSLGFDDLYDLPPYVASQMVVPEFLNKWKISTIPAKTKKSPEPETINGTSPVKFEQNGEANVEIKQPKKKEPEDSYKHGVISTIMKTYGFNFLLGSILKFIHDVLVFISPLLLRRIIGFAEDPCEQVWKGIVYALALLFTNFAQTIFMAKYFYDMYLIGMWIRSAVTSSIYRKSLRVSPQGKAETTTGEVVNLMSVDTQRLVDMMPYINMLWSSPLQIGIALFLLWQTLGPSVLSGLFVMIILVPINGAIAAKQRQFQQKQMKHKDSRVKTMNEILQGIKIIKLYGWEPSFENQVNDIRNKELRILKNLAYLSAGTSFIWTCAPFLVSLVTFATYVLVDENNILDTQKAFVSLALFNILRFPLSMLPMMIAGLVQSSVSVKRINKYMSLPELSNSRKNNVEPNEEDENNSAVKITNGSFKWSSNDEESNLKDIDLNVKKNSLVAVVGAVGSGKSSLMSAILGEMQRSEGTVEINGSLGYCAQQAWIQNATLKNNILFHKKLNNDRYNQVLEACALKSDLTTLPAGDATEIGEKGINLSGGQKHRVALARVVYSDVDICIMDDPLSAVDAHVGKHIFDNVISNNGLLKDKTRIFVTHAVSFLSQVDDILVIKDGIIAERGSFQELQDSNGPFSEYLKEYLHENNDDENNENPVDTTTVPESPENKDTGIRERKSSSVKRERKTSDMRDRAKSKTDEDLKTKQYEVEKMETGKVNLSVYYYYILNMGIVLFCSCVFGFAAYQVFNAVSSVWLARWSDDGKDKDLRNCTYVPTCVCVYPNITNDDDNSTLEFTEDMRYTYLGVYGLFGLGQAISAVCGSLLLYLSTLKGSKTLHNNMLQNILKSPLSFFDTTPQGRILNRFGKDVDVLDTTMPMIFRGWITCLLGVVATFVIISYSTPIFMAPVFVVMGFYYFVQKIYVATSRQLKRLESVSKSPIYSHFGETLNGAATIRAFHLQGNFITQSEDLVDGNQKAQYSAIVANRWLAIRLETVGNLIIFCSALLAVLGRNDLSPGMVGLSVTYALSVTQTLNWLVRMTSEVETNVVAAERLKEYSETKQEAKWDLESDEKHSDWPSNAVIELKNVSARYREGLPLVLKDLSFEIETQQKVGIVGRTGAGKSSITLALFRIVELDQGQICIDGIDIATIGLHFLRNRLTIIPQDPVLFSGTLRLNLDPFNKYSDDDLWQTLKISHLDNFVSSLKEGLQHIITEGGENLSVGQRQLICLARALLRKTKILVLDEATAAVDLETDDLIQATLREAFKDCTVLTIAHRLSTIMDYDKVIVMQDGQVAEYDEPQALLANKSTIFYSMCNDANLVK